MNVPDVLKSVRQACFSEESVLPSLRWTALSKETKLSSVLAFFSSLANGLECTPTLGHLGQLHRAVRFPFQGTMRDDIAP